MVDSSPRLHILLTGFFVSIQQPAYVGNSNSNHSRNSIPHYETSWHIEGEQIAILNISSSGNETAHCTAYKNRIVCVKE